jgi:hypothetical protein
LEIEYNTGGITMSWRDIVAKSPPLTEEDEKEIKDLMRFRNMTEEEAERTYRAKVGKLGTRRTVSYDNYMRNYKSEEFEKLTKVKCPKCHGCEDGCKHCDYKGYHKTKSKARSAFTR